MRFWLPALLAIVFAVASAALGFWLQVVAQLEPTQTVWCVLGYEPCPQFRLGGYTLTGYEVRFCSCRQLLTCSALRL